MNEHPCKKLITEYFNAMNEWIDATNALKRYVSTRPLMPGEDAPRIPLEEYRSASARAEQVFDDYKVKMDLYFECVNQFGVPPKEQE
jgi:hypothetical protein